MTTLNVIIFSRDRACQLDLLLRSIAAHVTEREATRLSVLYTTSHPDFGRGYEKVKQQHVGVRFVEEAERTGDFKALVNSLCDPAIPYQGFLADDDVFKERFSPEDSTFKTFAARPDVLCLSLRMGSHITYCYSLSCDTPPPVFEPGWIWSWKGLVGDWGYPMSLDGHVFRTGEIAPLLQDLAFENPNTLESSLAAQPLPQPRMICYERSRLVNLPVNRVQRVFENRSGEGDPAVLNDRFVSQNRRILLEPFSGFVNVSANQEVELEFSDGPAERHLLAE